MIWGVKMVYQWTHIFGCFQYVKICQAIHSVYNHDPHGKTLMFVGPVAICLLVLKRVIVLE